MTYNKYHNKKTEINGIKFDSKAEAERYLELLMMSKAGMISGLQRQVKFEIVPKAGKNKRARHYIADFVYDEDGKRVVEDVKSKISKTPVFSLKWALMQYLYPDYEYRIWEKNAVKGINKLDKMPI